MIINKDLPYPTEGNCFAFARVWVLLGLKMAGEASSSISVSNSQNPVVFFDITIGGQVCVLNFSLHVCSLVVAGMRDLAFHGCLSTCVCTDNNAPRGVRVNGLNSMFLLFSASKILEFDTRFFHVW